MTVSCSLAELTHTGRGFDAYRAAIPLGIGQVAANAIQHLGDAIDIELFKYPQDFAKFLSQGTPMIAGFSNYLWNDSLNHEFASRIKSQSPQTVTIFGGPNFPIEAEAQENYLREHPGIDFYIEGEGDFSFIELFRALEKFNFDVDEFKKNRAQSSNTRYVYGDKFFRGELMPRVPSLDALPSPYLTGIMDKFFDEKLFITLQTSRGCPYSCTFCHDGDEYMRKVKRFSQERINAEVDYMSERTKVKDITIVDLNFGIFKQDVETAYKLAECQKKVGWPTYIISCSAKNQKARVREMSGILNGALHAGASVQSTDGEVLKNIKRDNISLEQLTDVVSMGGNSLSEIILCLPGDTIEKHSATAFQMLNLGIKEVRTYQFILLKGTEAECKFSREKYRYSTRYRVTPRSFGRYEAYSETFDAFEYQEICVANSSMSYEDYLQCRDFTLIVEIFLNGGVFSELHATLERAGIPHADFFQQLWGLCQKGEMLPRLFREYRKMEEKNFWDTKEEFCDFLAQPDTLDKFESGQYGIHQIFHAQSIAYGEHFEDIVNIAFDTAHSLIQKNGVYGKFEMLFLDELKQYFLLTKGNLLSMEDRGSHEFHFDFVKIKETQFSADPSDFFSSEGLSFNFVRQRNHKKDFDNLYKRFGQDSEGLARIIRRMPGGMASLSREVIYSQGVGHIENNTSSSQPALIA